MTVRKSGSYKPRFKPGDLVVPRSQINGKKLFNEEVLPFRVLAVVVDPIIRDRVGERGANHRYEMDLACFPERYKPRVRRMMQGHLCSWIDRRDAVVESYREQLASIKALR